MCKIKRVLMLFVIVCVLFIQNISFGTQVVDNIKYAGEFEDCVFIGDSYTQMIPYYFGSSVDCEGHSGYPVKKLEPYIPGLVDRKKQNIIFFIGPNDYLGQEPLGSFYETLASYMRYLKANTKSRIFFCSYLDFMYNVSSVNQENMHYKVEMYDDMIKLLCQNEGIIYMNLWDIADVSKMRGFSDSEGENDLFHYGRAFYEEFFNHIKDSLKKQEEEEARILEELKKLQMSNKSNEVNGFSSDIGKNTNLEIMVANLTKK